MRHHGVIAVTCEARKDNADNSIVKQTLDAMIIFCQINKSSEATKAHFMNSMLLPVHKPDPRTSSTHELYPRTPFTAPDEGHNPPSFRVIL